MKDRDENESKGPLAEWATIVPPASLGTRTGKQRFVVTVKLAEKSLKTATSFVKELNEALQTLSEDNASKDGPTRFTLVDSERARLQRATADFSTFKAARTCLRALEDLGLPANEISAELEDFGKKQYDPWLKQISQSWWPWFAMLRSPAPEMPPMKITNRLDVTEGKKYKETSKGKLGKSDEEDRGDSRSQDEDEPREADRPRDDEVKPQSKKRRKKE